MCGYDLPPDTGKDATPKPEPATKDEGIQDAEQAAPPGKEVATVRTFLDIPAATHAQRELVRTAAI